MNNLTAEECRVLINGLSGNRSIREDKYLAALEIALPVLEKQGGWISCSERMPPRTPDSSVEYLVYETLNNRVQHDYFNVPEDGRSFQAFWNHYGDHVTHWQPLPAPPQPQPSTNPQIDNDGREG